MKRIILLAITCLSLSASENKSEASLKIKTMAAVTTANYFMPSIPKMVVYAAQFVSPASLLAGGAFAAYKYCTSNQTKKN